MLAEIDFAQRARDRLAAGIDGPRPLAAPGNRLGMQGLALPSRLDQLLRIDPAWLAALPCAARRLAMHAMVRDHPLIDPPEPQHRLGAVDRLAMRAAERAGHVGDVTTAQKVAKLAEGKGKEQVHRRPSSPGTA